METATSSSILISHPALIDNSKSIVHGYTGVLFADRWIIAHGSLLTAIAQRSPELLDSIETFGPGEIKFPEMEEAWNRIHGTDMNFLLYPCPDSVPEQGKLMAIWKCSLLNDFLKNNPLKNWTFQNDRFLPIILLIARQPTAARSCCYSSFEPEETRVKDILVELAKRCAIGNPTAAGRKGSTIEISSTPFGNPFFADSIARGIIGNLLGRERCLMLIDATVFPGSEGAPVYLIDDNRYRDRKILCGMVIASSCHCRKGERVEYTIAVNLLPSLNEILQTRIRWIDNSVLISPICTHDKRSAIRDLDQLIDTLERSVAIVRCGPDWGTAILMDEPTGTFITCAHVLAKASKNKIVLARSYAVPSRNTKFEWTAEAKLIYKTPNNKPYDIAVLKVERNCIRPNFMKPIQPASRPAVNGEPILAIGFPFCSTVGTTISNGIISKTSEYMIQSNCCAQGGVSGGPIVRPSSLELLGMIVCNTVSHTTFYPRLCMAIPTHAFKEPIDRYLQTADGNSLTELTQHDRNIEATWNLEFPFPRSNI